MIPITFFGGSRQQAQGVRLLILYKTPMHLTPQKSLFPLETMSQFGEPVIPDESAKGGRDPESSESSI